MRKRRSNVDIIGIDDSSQAISTSLYAKGEIIKTHCGYWHYGVSDGAGGVIHPSKKHDCKVVHTPLEKFSGGHKVLKSPDITSDDLTVAYKNAEARIGESYDLLNCNCEHFVREVHGLPSKTPQLQDAICAFSGGVAMTTGNPMMRVAALGATVGGALNEKNPATGAAVGAAIAFGLLVLLSKS